MAACFDGLDSKQIPKAGLAWRPEEQPIYSTIRFCRIGARGTVEQKYASLRHHARLLSYAHYDMPMATYPTATATPPIPVGTIYRRVAAREVGQRYISGEADAKRLSEMCILAAAAARRFLPALNHSDSDSSPPTRDP
ncbi:hypothetical protein EVAR_8464_1 [Eumeta japonica]|uniref:Uncharacterized protein n=1 Tax=Eumeta variegata TaxID=151549 RepID=A0A4C1WFF5_EUMVA|nr:hypothetical protein EVAR_8464_1 [Eumeta japonica]